METQDRVELLVFGDLTASHHHDLHELLHVKQSEALTAFFERVAFTLREELGRQPSDIQEMFPRFTTLIDLETRCHKAEAAPVLEFCLMTTCQLAKFILFAEDRQFPLAHDTYLLGVCAGSFAASAISVSQSVHETVVAGVEATRIAFRTALCSFVQRDMITRAGNRSWSVVVPRDGPGEKPMESLSRNPHKHNQLSSPYISAVAPNNITISGPPDVLDELVVAHSLKPYWLSIKSPFHAAHIFHDNHVDSVMAQFPKADFSSKKPVIPIFSGSTGEPATPTDFYDLLRWAVTGVLRQVVEWKDIIGAISASLSLRQAESCTITSFYCNATPLLVSQLAQRVKGLEAVQRPIASPPKQRRPSGRFGDSKIAILGYSGRYPDAASNDELWELLRAGRDVHTTIPKDRFDWETYHSPGGKQRNTSKVNHGCFIKDAGMFDPRFFNMSPREADNTDPAHRLAMMATYEAMEMAGMVPNRTPSTQQDRIGVFFGVTSDDWREANSSQDIDTYFIPGGVRAFMPGRISYFFRFSGPSLCIDTACSSSFAAIQSACGYLLRGDCDTAVAGGTNILTNPDIFTGLDRGHFLAPSGNCKTFDDEASGYCRAEAVGAVILKRLEDALEDGDPIAGVIVGAHTNHCGQTDSITRPHEGDQVSVFERVLRYQNIDANHVSYVEMHGTGTQAGDATEMRSVLKVFLPDERRSATQPLYLGSAKANVGHGESASGVVSLIKVLMMMKHGEIPPHCGITTRLNRNYPRDLAERNVRISEGVAPWRRKDSADNTRRAFINNFSAAGGNTALLVEDGPYNEDDEAQAEEKLDERVDENLGAIMDQVSRQVRAKRALYTVVASAKSEKALAANVASLVSFLEANPSTSLPALSYTTTARRLHHSYRIACSGDSTASILEQLRLRAQSNGPTPTAAKPPRIVFVFTGQGTLYAQLGRQLFDTVPRFHDDIVRFNQMAQQQGFPPFVSLIDGTATSLDNVDVCATHLALVCLQMALSRLWTAWKIRPSLVVGHSLGEYAALHTAGVLSASDAIFLVGTRASLLAQRCKQGTHAMLAVKAPLDVVQPLLEEFDCEVSCLNHPAETVVGGPRERVTQLAKQARSLGFESTLLEIPFSFHTSQVDPILGDFETAARSVHYGTPEIPILSPLLARVVENERLFDAGYLVNACRRVVNIKGALEDARDCSMVDDKTIWLQIGSHPICSGMIKSTLGSQSITLASLRKSTVPSKCITDSLEAMYVKGLDIDWNNHHGDFGESSQVIQLPRYNWNLSKHWIMYRNDFLLTKGEGSAVLPKQAAKQEYPYLSPSVQRVLEQKHGSDISTLLAESDIFDKDLAPVLQGHLVNGAALCPSSLYGDVALTVAKAMVEGNKSACFAGFDVSNMKIDRPLIALPSETTHLFRVSATANWTSQLIAMSLYSVDSAGKTTANHATVNVRLRADASVWLDEWKRMAYLINGRIAALESGVTEGDCHKMKRSMVYKLFTSIVDYSSEYQGMQQVILDSEELEATAKVSFRVDEQGFVMNPRWIDSLGHLAGFIMNGNENVSPKHAFVNHGWDQLRFGEAPQMGKVYTTYNRMQLVHGTLYAGDTYVLDGKRIIAVFNQVAFQQVPRSLLDNLLPSKKAQSAKSVKASKKDLSVATSLTAPKQPAQHDALPSPPPSPPADYMRVLQIIAQEVRIEVSELQPDCLFADLGLDSLLSLTITSRINDELGISVPPTLFTMYPAVKDLQSLFTPSAEASVDTQSVSCSHTEDGGSRDSTIAAGDEDNMKAVVRGAIAEQTGTPIEQLVACAVLAQLGVDSLLSLSIADLVTEALGVQVSSSHFLDHETLGEMEAALGKELGFAGAGLVKPSTAMISLDDEIISNPPHATSIVLHRARGQVPHKTLFLLPDGSGSAASYAAMAKFDSHVTVYGINCPWRTTPEEMTRLGVTTRQVMAKFIAEIRKHQPHGPYYLGGWSAGGIFAYEAVRGLVAAGETVERLFLIDAPNPIGLENPPPKMFDFFDRAGVFGNMGSGKVVPPWLRHHFESVVQMLDSYKAEALPQAAAPPTLVVYARDGVCNKDASAPQMETSPGDAREMLWLLHDRTDFSASGWASLVGRDNVSVCVLDRVNHFTMMNEGAHMDVMRERLGRAMV